VFEITGKRVIITGGARGMGAATAAEFARQGARVAIFDVLDDLGRQLASEVTEAGRGSVSYHNVDVSSRTSTGRGVADAVETLGGLDAMFNFAGIQHRVSVEHMTDDEWDRIFDVNVKGTFLMNQAVFRHLKDHGGSIVNVGSDDALRPQANGSHYSASKGAVISFTRSVAAEWARYGIRVNALIPAIWTPMYEEYRSAMTPAELAAHDESQLVRIPLGGRLGDAETDLAPVMVFLASSASKFITGQMIPVNGLLGWVR
jgi:NAD(P)-dependent dehydrogenase (short-subunit alcohol dehydrogenase family)